MENTNIMKNLIDGYNALSATTNYIMGFIFAGMVYMSFAKEEDLPYLMTLDKASRGQGYSLRFKPNKGQKAILMQGATAICSKEMFEEMVADSKYNRGEIFEKLVTEYMGQTWEKDNIPFTVAGDINVDGIEYQIKFEKATFTNEKTLIKMMGGC